MDIAIVHPALDVKGGAENIVVWLASGLVQRGHRVRVITSRVDRGLFTSVPWNFETVEMGGHGYAVSWSGMRKTATRLRPLLEGAELVNPHNFPANFWTYWAMPERGTPAAWFCQEPLRVLYRPPLDPHVRQLLRQRRMPLGIPLRRLVEVGRKGPDWWRIRRMDRQVARWYPLVLTNSHFVADQVRVLFDRTARVCRLGIPTVPRSATAPPREGLHLLLVARMTVEKNVETVLKAIAALPPGVAARVRLTVIGDGPERPYLSKMREVLGLQGRVDFRGLLSDAELDREYRDSDALIYLSLDETFGLVFAEAAARGKPSIGANHGGPTEFIEDGRTGLLVDALDPDAVAEAIASLASDAERRLSMGRAARSKVEAEYTIDAMVSRYLALVHSTFPALLSAKAS